MKLRQNRCITLTNRPKPIFIIFIRQVLHKNVSCTSLIHCLKHDNILVLRNSLQRFTFYSNTIIHPNRDPILEFIFFRLIDTPEFKTLKRYTRTSRAPAAHAPIRTTLPIQNDRERPPRSKLRQDPQCLKRVALAARIRADHQRKLFERQLCLCKALEVMQVD